MPKPPTLRSPKLAIILGDPSAPDTWTEVEVQSIGADMVRVEEHMSRAKKPTEDFPILSQQVLGYYALHRARLVPVELSYDQFAAECVEVAALEATEVGPTPAGPSGA